MLGLTSNCHTLKLVTETHHKPKIKIGVNMNLQPHECDQFYRIWWSLLSYVNNQMKLIDDFQSQRENCNINQQDALIIRNALWASDRISWEERNKMERFLKLQ